MEKKTEESEEEDEEMTELFSVFKNDDGAGTQIEKSQFHFSFNFPTYEEFCQKRSENMDGINQSVNGKYEDEDEEELHELRDEDQDEFMEIHNYKEKEHDEEEEEGETEILEEIENGQQQQLLADEEEEAEVCSMKGPFEIESDSDSSCSILPRRFVVNPLMAIFSDGFLSDRDFGGEFEPETPIYVEGDCICTMELPPSSSEELHAMGSSPELELGDFYDEEDEENIYSMEDLNEMEVTHLRAMGKHENSDFLNERDFLEAREEDIEEEEEDRRETTDKLEPLWEHQDLIEQLEMEMKKARATGLPTILEDSECPKLMEDLKPWKISEKYEHGDRIGEFQRFCKTYTERMRKFDILNFQKMYAIGFLQLKDPLRPVRVKRSYVQMMRALVLHKVRLDKSSKDKTNPTTKFIRELQDDLEVVYIGQMCLSWEFLRWQYERELEPWELEGRKIRKYNHVAREFQQFCVLIQRFMEDETVNGPRIHCYVKSRQILRNLLQVPLVRDDYIREKKKPTKMSEYDITSDMLVEIIEESIKTFWDFLRADKDCNIVPLQKGSKEIHLEPKDLELFVEIQKDLYKKDKHMRDALHSENSILKMLRRNRGEEKNPDQLVYFLAQVDMRLVGRVLNMCRLTSDQLIWCRNKLNKINFVGKKIHVEPSFLLFPC
ncbi:uncharacterized protein LOC124926622 [Impatiens glandulifera]|uniref:uncharacterized protein LOC124926622 n=1 Tax=Impatiens glandulifera TaxID=253017 RepID=UPI001FB1A1D2|nr:uncharacterized protein LOC124926622 [Impatiens glandulifera]